jgi:hypothetical protein
MKIYNDREIVKGMKTTTVLNYGGAEEFSTLSPDKKFIAFTPKK